VRIKSDFYSTENSCYEISIFSAKSVILPKPLGNTKVDIYGVTNMTAAQPNLVQRAKQGEVSAIIALLNQSLRPNGITATAKLEAGRLDIILKASHPLDPNTWIAFLKRGLSNLSSPVIQEVRVCHQQTSDNSYIWNHGFSLKESLRDELSKTIPSVSTQEIREVKQKETVKSTRPAGFNVERENIEVSQSNSNKSPIAQNSHELRKQADSSYEKLVEIFSLIIDKIDSDIVIGDIRLHRGKEFGTLMLGFLLILCTSIWRNYIPVLSIPLVLYFILLKLIALTGVLATCISLYLILCKHKKVINSSLSNTHIRNILLCFSIIAVIVINNSTGWMNPLIGEWKSASGYLGRIEFLANGTIIQSDETTIGSESLGGSEKFTTKNYGTYQVESEDVVRITSHKTILNEGASNEETKYKNTSETGKFDVSGDRLDVVWGGNSGTAVYTKVD
jgi:hypothetical protein